jgi:hypothetical protein
MGCGYYRIYSNRELGDYMCTDFSDIYYKIIPFFKKHPILEKKIKIFQIELRQLNTFKLETI